MLYEVITSFSSRSFCSAAIRALTDALGYRFQRQGSDFLHPVAVAVVAPDGTIVRYLQGTLV